MKVFLSFAIENRQLYVITLLAEYLQRHSMTLTSSYHDLLRGNQTQIPPDTGLFIGVMTATLDNTNVLNEWIAANNMRIPSLLLVEEGIPVTTESYNNPNIIQFNRHAPEKAISDIENRRNQIVHAQASQATSSNALAWILGGLAVVALVKYLSDDED